MTSLVWTNRAALVLLVVFAGSQIALWAKVDKVNDQLAQVGGQLAQLALAR